VAGVDPAKTAEARRVAASAVIGVDHGDPPRTRLEWVEDAPRGWGEDVSVVLFPEANGDAWSATAGAVAETLGDGFDGELTIVGDAVKLGAAIERAGAAGMRMRPLEAPPAASLANRARIALDATGGRIHVFITGPAVPLPDWLPAIAGLFSPSRDAGVVATRILASDGSLAAAGGLLAPDGSRRRRGEGDPDPDRPEYRFVRPVDFCAPPVLATRRDVFERLGGFGNRSLEPAEAIVDFSLRAGKGGAEVCYQPQARVVALGEAVR
jgi:hypothetical protein